MVKRAESLDDQNEQSGSSQPVRVSQRQKKRKRHYDSSDCDSNDQMSPRQTSPRQPSPRQTSPRQPTSPWSGAQRQLATKQASSSAPTTPSIKIKLNTPAPSQDNSESDPESVSTTASGRGKKLRLPEFNSTWKGQDDVFKTKRQDEDTSDEEKEWLSALEEGKLNERGDVERGEVDTSMMTARQRARLHGKPEETLLQLPTGYKTLALSDEQLEKRKQRAKIRREIAAKKDEKDKKQTLDRLLKKQDTRLRGSGSRGRDTKEPIARCRYIDNVYTGISVQLPDDCSIDARKAPRPPAVQLCAVPGCSNPKKYCCSQTGIPLCSLQCYQHNLSRNKQA